MPVFVIAEAAGTYVVGLKELSPHGGNSELGGDTANDEGPIPEGINHVAAHGWQVAYRRSATLVLFPSSSLVT